MFASNLFETLNYIVYITLRWDYFTSFFSKSHIILYHKVNSKLFKFQLFGLKIKDGKERERQRELWSFFLIWKVENWMRKLVWMIEGGEIEEQCVGRVGKGRQTNLLFLFFSFGKKQENDELKTNFSWSSLPIFNFPNNMKISQFSCPPSFPSFPSLPSPYNYLNPFITSNTFKIFFSSTWLCWFETSKLLV